jgi:hypothetical protein
LLTVEPQLSSSKPIPKPREQVAAHDTCVPHIPEYRDQSNAKPPRASQMATWLPADRARRAVPIIGGSSPVTFWVRQYGGQIWTPIDTQWSRRTEQGPIRAIPKGMAQVGCRPGERWKRWLNGPPSTETRLQRPSPARPTRCQPNTGTPSSRTRAPTPDQLARPSGRSSRRLSRRNAARCRTGGHRRAMRRH